MSDTVKTIVFTGVSRGIGRAAVKVFAELGHSIIGCARDEKRLRDLEAELSGKHFLRALDVSDDDAVSRFAAEALAALSVPDIVINNAALINETAPLWEIGAPELDALIDVNIKGTANILRHFLPPMIRRKQGVIVNFSSEWGRSVAANVAPYCASKFAIEGLTKALAEELPSGMAAVPLNPGIIDTDMLRTIWADGASAYPNPEEWALRAVPFILAIGPRQNGKSLSVR